MDSKEFMSHPSQWPLLPVKKYTKNDAIPSFGFMIEGRPLTVYHGSVYDLEDPVDLNAINHSDYQAVDELLAAGWVVD